MNPAEFDKRLDIRFSRFVETQGDCLIWTGKLNKDGYGRFSIKRREVPAHVFSYERTIGLVPDALELDHLCKCRRCVNPLHLEPVTHRENLMRSPTLQAINAAKTHCINGHAFTEENTVIVDGWRQCRACIRIRKKKYRAKRRQEVFP